MYLTGKKVALRWFREHDLPDLKRLLNAPEVQYFTEEDYPVNWSEDMISSFYSKAFKGKKEMYAVETNQGLFVGEVWLNPINFGHDWGEMVLTILPEHQNRGYGKEAVELILRHGFNHLNLHRIEVKVYSFNERAHHVYLSSGFTEEGRMRERIQRKGKYYDQIWLSILREEYFRLREGN